MSVSAPVPSPAPCLHHAPATLPRRRFLQAAAATVAGSGAALLLPRSAAADVPADPDSTDLAFALISDTHLSIANSASAGRMALVWESIAKAGPQFVLHCGDITDTGFAAEFDLYDSLVPASLARRIRYTPGNHEVRWDASAEEIYHQQAGPAPYSLTAGGVHFVGFDPTQLLQEPGHIGDDDFEWLEHDLRRAGRQLPTMLFQHHPMGDLYAYIDDQDRFFDLAQQYNVRGLFAGHLHKQAVQHMNGLTQFVADAVKVKAVYYWAERSQPRTGPPVLTITRVDVAADGTETRSPAAMVALAGNGDGRPYRPSAVRTAASPGRVSVDLTLPRHISPALVQAQFFAQEAFSGTATAAAWQSLTAGHGGHWTGQLDTSALPPGPRRLQTRVLGADGSWWDDVRAVTLPRAGRRGPRVVWQEKIGGSVQGALAQHRRTVVAASTNGAVVAFEPGVRRADRQWRAEVGPVYRRPSFTADGSTLIVPSADHRVTALRGTDGHRRWSRDLGAPVLGSPLVAGPQGDDIAFVTAGNGLWALAAADGKQLWRTDNHGFFAGRADSDGSKVFLGSGDGRFRAYDAGTGAEVWAFDVTTGADHVRLLYGAWDQTVRVIGGTVLACTVSATWGLDKETGAVLWSVPGSVMYAPPLVLTDGSVLLIQERGKTVRLRTTDGAQLWESLIPFAVINGGPVGDGRTAWVQGVSGQIIAVDLATGALRDWTQISSAYTFSTPVLMDDLLVAADQDGIVRGIAL